jgi:hypothetical protein
VVHSFFLKILHDYRRGLQNQIRVFLKRKAFRITETEEKLIAAPAIMGLRRIPKNG